MDDVTPKKAFILYLDPVGRWEVWGGSYHSLRDAITSGDAARLAASRPDRLVKIVEETQTVTPKVVVEEWR